MVAEAVALAARAALAQLEKAGHVVPAYVLAALVVAAEMEAPTNAR